MQMVKFIRRSSNQSSNWQRCLPMNALNRKEFKKTGMLRIPTEYNPKFPATLKALPAILKVSKILKMNNLYKFLFYLD